MNIKGRIVPAILYNRSIYMITAFLKNHKVPQFRSTQFYQAFYRDFISSFDELFTWPAILREDLKKEIPFTSITPIRDQTSADKSTVKILFKRLSDSKQFESVLIRHEDGRNTVCVSCMIGCPMGCTFCATGEMGFKGNLSGREIVDQVLYFARELRKENKSVSNIVFMGMGEPLSNLENVWEAIKIFTDPKMFAMSMRRITISTCGITPYLHKLIAKGYKGRLALSLHAPNQELREMLMPIAYKFPLTDLLAEFKEFARITNKRVSYEYILIAGINDQPRHAHILAKLLDPHLEHINLIPYNRVKDSPFERSDPASIKRFSDILAKYRIQHTIRVTMGDDIKAACGQLAG